VAKRMRRMGPLLPVAVALGCAGVMTVASISGASHPRPKSASVLRLPLVPAYNQCTSPNRMHGPPLAFSSCNPPGQASSYVTVGTPDANGAPANSVGEIRVKVYPGAGENIVVTGTISDVRCKPGTAAGVCSSANTTAGPDYSGQLQLSSSTRVTDHYNAVDPGGGTDPATVVEMPAFQNTAFCASTADTSTGGVCNFANATQCTPPPQCSGVRDGDRTVAEISQLKVFDGGQDGNVFTSPNTLFAIQGLFVP
jgi:hypothetical protein